MSALTAALAGLVAPGARALVAAYWTGRRGLSPLAWQLALKKGVVEGAGIEPVRVAFCR